MIRAALLALCASQVAGTKLLFVNGSMNNYPGGTDSQLLELDLDAKTSRVVLESGLDAQYWFVDGSVVCGSLWYGVADNFVTSMNIAVVDISGSTGKLVGIKALDFKPYNLKCGKQLGELIATGDDQGAPPTLSLYRVGNLTSAVAPTTTIIGSFFPAPFNWIGYPSIFQFTEDSLYAHFAETKGKYATYYNSGVMYKMDLATGSITTHKQYEGTPGMPVFVSPSDGKSTGVFGKKISRDQFDYYFCDVDASGEKVNVSQCKKDKQRHWYNVGVPALCDKKYYFTSWGFATLQHREYTPIFDTDMSSGHLSNAFHLKFGPAAWYAGTLSCSPSSAVEHRVLV